MTTHCPRLCLDLRFWDHQEKLSGMDSINRTLLPANPKLKIVSHGFCDLQQTFPCFTVPHCKHDTSINVFEKKKP